MEEIRNFWRKFVIKGLNLIPVFSVEFGKVSVHLNHPPERRGSCRRFKIYALAANTIAIVGRVANCGKLPPEP